MAQTGRAKRIMKCVVVGDPGVGKTSLIVSYNTRLFPYHDLPLVISDYRATVTTETWSLWMNIWDTASGAEHDVMRPLVYQGADLIIICYSTVDVQSFYNVANKWWPEVYSKAHGVPFILVGTKADIRRNLPREQPCITYEQGAKMQRDIGAIRVVECSALSHENRDRVFLDAAKIVMSAWRKAEHDRSVARARAQSRRSCTIM